MGDASQIFVEDKLVFRGREIILKPPTLKTRGLFGDSLEKNAVWFLRRNKETFDTEYSLAMERLVRKGGSFGYRWGSEACNEALHNDEGFQAFALYWLKQSNQNIDAKLIQDLWDEPGGKVVNFETGEEEDATLGAELVNKFWRMMRRPNSTSPAKEPGTS